MHCRTGMVCLVLIAALLGPGPASAALTHQVVVQEDVDVPGSPDPLDPPTRTFQVNCPPQNVATDGRIVDRAAPLAVVESSVKPGKQFWTFRFVNSSQQPQRATVEVNCLYDPKGDEDLSVALAAKLLGPSEEAAEALNLSCPRGAIPIGHGFKEPDAGKPGVSSRLAGVDARGRKETVTIQNTGTVPFETKQIAVCAQTELEIKGFEVRLKMKSEPATVTVQSNGEGFLGSKCPKKFGAVKVIGAVSTDFGPLADGIFGLLNASASVFEAPTRIINGNPGPETVKGETNCLGYEVL